MCIRDRISVEPSAGVLYAEESMDLVVTFTSANIDYGVHNADTVSYTHLQVTIQ